MNNMEKLNKKKYKKKQIKKTVKTLHFVQWHVLGYNTGTMAGVRGGQGKVLST